MIARILIYAASLVFDPNGRGYNAPNRFGGQRRCRVWRPGKQDIAKVKDDPFRWSS